MKNVIKTVCVIIGTIIGAGFASGREIYIFFTRYGLYGFFGLIISSTLIGFIIYKVLIQMDNTKIYGYSDYLDKLGVHKKIREVINIIVNIFLLISFYVMIAGFCAYFNQEFNLSPVLMGITVCVMCYFTFMNRIDGVTKINTIIIPLLIVMIFIIGWKSNALEISDGINKVEGNWFIASLEYTSYNSIILIPMLIGLQKNTKGKEKIIGGVVTVFFFILATILYAILLQQGVEVENIELPLIYAVSKLGIIYKYIYGVVIVSAIYTSAIAAGYGFIENCSKNKKSYKYLSIILCTSAIFFSTISFSKLVDLLYPVFGIIGLIQVIIILLKNTKSIEKKDEN